MSCWLAKLEAKLSLRLSEEEIAGIGMGVRTDEKKRPLSADENSSRASSVTLNESRADTP